MRTKTNKLRTGLLSLFALCLLAISLFIVAPKNGVTAHAATSGVLTTNGHFENIAGTPLNAYNPSDYIKVTIQPSIASGTGTIQNNETLNWTYMTAKVEVLDTKRFKEHFSVRLIKDDIEVVNNTLSGTGNTTLFSTSLTDGDYTIIYRLNISLPNSVTYLYFHYVFNFKNDITAPKATLSANGNPLASGSYTNKSVTYSASDTNFKYIYYKKPSASTFSTTTDNSYFVEATTANSGWWEFYAVDSLGNASSKVKAYLDCIAPTMSCSSGVSFGGTTGKAFTVTATDAGGTSKLYVKYESEEWFTNGSSYYVPTTERNGRYYFYAEDEFGNKTDTKWVVLSTDNPVGRMVKSESDNSVSFVWDSEYWSATLDGNPYRNGTWVTDEGNHIIVLSNNADKQKTYNFSIEHYYIQTSREAASCKEGGRVTYECMQCGDIKEENVYAMGHQYSVINKPSTCTEQGEAIYTCTLCGESYSEKNEFPTGHTFTSHIKKIATCKHDGLRESVCEDCGYTYEEVIKATGHSYELTNERNKDLSSLRTYTCSVCGDSYTQELSNQYGEVTNYVEYLFEQYSPYMIWVFIATAGLWSIAIGVALIIARKNEDKEKAKKMLINYVIGLVAIFVILVACPYLVRGIAILVT